jgi:hypothetical protein
MNAAAETVAELVEKAIEELTMRREAAAQAEA